ENKANKTAGPKEANNSVGTQDNIDAGNSEMEAEHVQEYFVLPLWSFYNSTVNSSEAKNRDQKLNVDIGAARASSTNYVNTASTQVNTASTPVNTASTPVNTASPLRNINAIEPKKISKALEDESWVDVVQEELLQFKTQQVWILVDLPFEKKDERGVVVRNKVRLVAQRHRQEEGIDYGEVFASVARIEAIRIFFGLYLLIVVEHNTKRYNPK
nr:putative ribonuclease H-like domain-containing protein [Tanacetum cinerariifolium]